MTIGVRTNAVGTYTDLSPRQPLTPAPYAVFAPQAGVADTVAAGQVTKSVNGLRDDLTLAAGANLTLTTSGQTLMLASPADWHLGGNAGSIPGQAFLGTIDNQPLEFKVNATRAMRIEPGTNAPNLIGGAASNSVAPGVQAATIAGGGLPLYPNTIMADFASIGGGTFHIAAGPLVTIGGGRDNRAYSESSSIAGGYNNNVLSNATYSTIGGGSANTIGSSAICVTTPWWRGQSCFGPLELCRGPASERVT